jgi:transcriptional regulator with XRE-family HTH domain
MSGAQVPAPSRAARSARLVRSAYPDNAAASIVADALQASERTLGAVCRAAGVAQSAVQYWLNGKQVPYRENIEALARELNAPALLDLIPSRRRQIVMLCTVCGGESQWPTHVALREGRHPERTIDLEAGHGTWTCEECGSRASLEDYWTKYRRRLAIVRKSQGSTVAAQWAKKNHPAASWSKSRPALESRRANMAKAHQKIRGEPLTSEHRHRLALRKMALFHDRQSYAFDYCRACGQIMWWKRAAGDPKFVMHRPCRDAFRRESGRNAAPPRPRGRRLSRPELVETYEVVIRNLAGRESHDLLAREYSMTRQAIGSRIGDFLANLPHDDRGGQHLLRRAEALRHASRE